MLNMLSVSLLSEFNIKLAKNGILRGKKIKRLVDNAGIPLWLAV